MACVLIYAFVFVLGTTCVRYDRGILISITCMNVCGVDSTCMNVIMYIRHVTILLYNKKMYISNQC